MRSVDPVNEVVEKRKLWDELLARAHKLHNAYVKVGILESKGAGEMHRTDGGDALTLVEIMAVHEIGSSDGRIPERAPIRTTFLVRAKDELVAMQTKLARAIVTDGMDPIKALKLLGTWSAAAVKRTITEEDLPPPLRASTIARKGSTKPLVDTGLLKNSISFEVIEEETGPDGTPSRTTMPKRGG
jgi:hypothetical protein